MKIQSEGDTIFLSLVISWFQKYILIDCFLEIHFNSRLVYHTLKLNTTECHHTDDLMTKSMAYTQGFSNHSHYVADIFQLLVSPL